MSTTKMTAPAGLSDGAVVQTEFGSYTVSSGTATVDSRVVAGLMAAGWAVFDGAAGASGVSDESRLDALEALPLVNGGSHTVSAGENTANAAVIDTGFDDLVSFNVQILRSGIDVTADAAISATDGSITVADNSTDYVLGTGDVINWIAIGTYDA